VKPPLSAILFDLDGTLVDSYALYLEAYRRALEPRLGRRPVLEDFVRHRPSSELHFLRQWVGGAAEECHREMQRHYRDLHGTHCEGLYEGVREMLTALRAGGVRLGIVTGKGRVTWEDTHEQLDLGDFEVVVTEDDVERPKPHPAGLQLALETMGISPAEAIYVGDSVTDMEAGRAAGMRIGAALWPKTAPGEAERFRAELAPLSPEWHFARPAAITRALAPWCGAPTLEREGT
jgi:HAD superfamily hydrolase (TIGR01509 family)